LAVAHGSLHKSFLQLAALLVLGAAAALARGDRRGAWIAGACAGAAFLFRHDAGTFGAAALALGVLVERGQADAGRVRRLVLLGGGFLLVVGPAALALLVGGLEPRAWWEHEWQRIAVQERIAVSFPWPWGAEGFNLGRLVLATALLAAPL